MQWSGKLDGQETGTTYRGQKLSDAGTMARFYRYRAVADVHLPNIIKVNLSAEMLSYEIDKRALSRARTMDGKLILISNMPDHAPAEIVARAIRHWPISSAAFRLLKSAINIVPMFHRPPNRFRAHVLICFLALVLYQVLRLRLKDKESQHSPARAREIARRIQFQQITLHQRQSASGLSALTPQQKALFATVPSRNRPPSVCSDNIAFAHCAHLLAWGPFCRTLGIDPLTPENDRQASM